MLYPSISRWFRIDFRRHDPKHALIPSAFPLHCCVICRFFCALTGLMVVVGTFFIGLFPWDVYSYLHFACACCVFWGGHLMEIRWFFLHSKRPSVMGGSAVIIPPPWSYSNSRGFQCRAKDASTPSSHVCCVRVSAAIHDSQGLEAAGARCTLGWCLVGDAEEEVPVGPVGLE